jgi:acyl-coenzyme A synthetase/AMP-(fatty) acid ligase
MYGLTEAFRSTFLDPACVDTHPGSIGKAVPGEEMLILDKSGSPVPPGGTGELVHRGTFVARGYWADPEATQRVYRRNPLQDPNIPIPEMAVYSGDHVRVDEDGFLYFVGRMDEMMKCAGIRVSPHEVESVLYASGKISGAVCFGVPHDIYGEQVFAAVSLLEGCDGSGILHFCKERLPHYMVPSEIDVWQDLPKNSNGKLDRPVIKKRVFDQLGFVGVTKNGR